MAMQTPVGTLNATFLNGHLTDLSWAETCAPTQAAQRKKEGNIKTSLAQEMPSRAAPSAEEARQNKDACALLEDELSRYFNGELQSFNVLIQLKGTPYQKRVWNYLLTIPYGETRTYKQVAEAIGSHPRAVGGAVGANPIPILVPCHRVMGSAGALTGYSGGDGVETKRKLLRLEGVSC